MKKEFVSKKTWPFLILLGLFVVSCNKNLDVDVKGVKITREEVDIQTTSVTINGSYQFPSVLKDIFVCLGKDEDLKDAETYRAKIDGNQFTFTKDDLRGDTKYYYRYEFDNGMDKARSDVKSFTTNPYDAAAVATDSIISVQAKTAVCVGTILNTAGSSVVKYGVCWSTNDNPTIYGHKKDTVGDITGHFIMKFSDLRPNTVYYARAYFISAKDYQPVYGRAERFETKSGIPATSIRKIEKGIESAVCTYAVYDGNGLPVLEHGICWSSLSENPSLDHCDGHVQGGESLGQSFSVEMNSLVAGTQYHVCVYAKNEDGFHYSQPSQFTTHTGTPVISGFKVTRIKHNSALLQVSLTDDDHLVSVVEKGFLWSRTNSNPEIGNNCDDSEICGTGTGGYWVKVDRFEEEQDYYVRPYAKYNVGMYQNIYHYGEVKHFKTTKKGGLPGAFTINDNGDQVCFSQSNLEYLASSNNWCFAENQWEYIGISQGNSLQSTDRDLFGWGTSGRPHGAEAYYPWATVAKNSKYWAYGSYYNHLFNGTGEADWGYNKIHIPSLYTSIQENVGWRTLSCSEWKRLVNLCRWAGRFSPGSIVVDDQTYHGHILLPDDWTLPTGLSFTPNALNWTTNAYTRDQWYEMEAAGAVFLPAAGFRYKGSGSSEATDIGHCNQIGYYWSSSIQKEGTSWRIVFDLSESAFNAEPNERFLGHSVRLVKNL